MAIQIANYTRPGIYINEFDNSVVVTPTVTGLSVFVPGVSKKGPVNTPILVSNIQDFQNIFGNIDRSLERNGSFFHRTVQKILETNAVYAMNLLKTDDTLDQIEYVNMSASTQYTNAVVKEAPYRRFFDTTGFWKRDTDSFISITKDSTYGNVDWANNVLSFTNMSSQYATVFIFKTRVTGFDVTMLQWYGNVNNMPAYVYPTDYASDYMVDVVIVGGDWSDYSTLSNDPRWSQYFDSSGLIKSKVTAFTNDRNVSVLGNYAGLSLIPYFRNQSGTNIFIETVINRDTDKTGIFCSFNADIFEKSYPTGLVDLIGSSIVGNEDVTDIEFLSYKETITEAVSFTNTVLDRPGNVFGVLNPTTGPLNADHSFDVNASGDGGFLSGILVNSNRTGWFVEGYVHDVGVTYSLNGTASITLTFSALNDNTYAVINETYITVNPTASFTVLPSDVPYSSTTASYVVPFYLSTDGEIYKKTPATSNPDVLANDLVLGYYTFATKNGGIIATWSMGPTYTPVAVKTTGFNPLTFNTDYTITSSSGDVTVTFLNTANAPVRSQYSQYRRFKAFNSLVSVLDNVNVDKASLGYSASVKLPFSEITVSDIVTSQTSNKSFVLQTGLLDSELSTLTSAGQLVVYKTDNEQIIGNYGLITKDTKASLSYLGVASVNSNLYSKFETGMVNSGDYFYENLCYDGLEVIFVNGTTGSFDGNSYVVFFASDTDNINDFINGSTLNNTGDTLIFPDSLLNKGTFTTVDTDLIANGPAKAYQMGYVGSIAGSYSAYQVSSNVVDEVLYSTNRVWNYNTKIHLQMYIDSNNILTANFVDFYNESLSTTWSVPTFGASMSLTYPERNQIIYVQSEDSNYKESVDVVIPSGYSRVPNKILCNGERYTEVKVGDFLEASIDPDTIVTGQMPKRLARILSKKLYAFDTTLVEITCDGPINVYNFGGNLQTVRYSSIDNYASTYKGSVLKGFRIRQAQLPDGTEDRQTTILNLVAKGTPLFKAVANKEAFDFRYLVDSFGLGLTDRSKQQLVDICGDRLDALGFISMPSIKSFKSSTSPTFVDEEGVLQTEYIAEGGDPQSSPSFLYSFGDGAGVSAVGYFLPYVTVNDNGRPLSVPPAPYVANTYLRKQNSNITTITPWTIAAGVTNGRVTNISGVEIDFTPEDISNLNLAQMNPIVFKRNRGYVIETENTGQTLVKSALSYLHVREVLIELEREMGAMLLDFQWKFNTPEIRAEIKLRADVICEKYVSKNGLYNYFNKCDEENNTPDVIDSQIGVLDTYVEPIKGMGIIVNNITILRTGAIQSGGFITP